MSRVRSKADRMHRRETTSPLNLLGGRSGLWSEAWLAHYRVRLRAHQVGEDVVTFHKRVLGQQTCCWIGGSANRRHWVWDRQTWRVYVNTEAGVQFEVPEDATPEQVWEALGDYSSALGLKESSPAT